MQRAHALGSGRPGRICVADRVPILVFALALAARLFGLSAEPFWYDEILTARRAALPVWQLVAEAATNMHPPTYFLLLKATAAFGSGEWFLRVPSALAGAASAAVAALLARRLAPQAILAAPIAGLLVACQPFQLLYGQEARSYALVGLLVMIALLGIAAIAEAGAHAGRRAWLAWAIGTGGALALTNNAIPFLAPAIIGLIAVVRSAPAGERPVLRRRATLAVGAVLLMWLPALALTALPIKNTIGPGWWVPPVTWITLKETVDAAYLFAVTEPVTFDIHARPPLALGVVALAAAIWGLWTIRKSTAACIALGLSVLALPAVLLLVSLWRPVFLPRYLFWGIPPFLVLAGLGLGQLTRLKPGRAPHFATIGLVAVLCGWSVSTYHTVEKRARWDEAMAWLAANATAADTIYVDHWISRFVFQAHQRRLGDAPTFRVVDDPDELEPELREGRTVWMVWGRSHFGQRGKPEDNLRRMADSLGVEPVSKARIGRSIAIANVSRSQTNPLPAGQPPRRPRA